MKKNVIVSLADANYYPLLNELVDSIKRFKESENTAICILDAGLTEDQKQKLSNKVDEIKSALERDNFMTADTAKSFGLIDEVVEKRS